MEKSTRLLLFVGVASFAMGAAVDHVLFSRGEAGAGPVKSRKGPAKATTSLRAADSSRQGERSQADGSSKKARRAEGTRQGGENPIPRSVREVLHELERGGGIDAGTANRLLEEAPAGRARREVLHRIARHWARQDPEGAAAWAGALEGADRQRALREVLHGWAEEDPEGAAKFIVQLPTSEQNLHIVHAMAYRWAERDQAAAMEWAAAQTNPAHRERAIGGVVSSWSESDPAAAAAFAASLESYYDRYRVLEVAAQRWAGQDTSAAIEWAQGLPRADRQRATQSILREVAERDPARAAAVYQELTAALPDESHRHDYRRMAEQIASVWSSSSPREAADWAVRLPEAGEVQRSAVRSVAEHWLRIDSVAAGEWILRLPEGDTRDAAAERVVRTTVRSDPATAFEWANSLSDVGHSTGLMRDVLRQWKTTDAASAQAALDAAIISPEQRRELGRVLGVVPAPPPEPTGNE